MININAQWHAHWLEGVSWVQPLPSSQPEQTIKHTVVKMLYNLTAKSLDPSIAQILSTLHIMRYSVLYPSEATSMMTTPPIPLDLVFRDLLRSLFCVSDEKYIAVTFLIMFIG